jgi:hypothetical protein
MRIVPAVEEVNRCYLLKSFQQRLRATTINNRCSV